MCGIAGSINFQLDTESLCQAMIHRGPDAQKGISIDQVHLFHFRLSILDMEGGVQPMQHRGRYSIVFNGEIYNHQELRKKFSLEAQTRSDTETILLLYEKMGVDCLQHFDGMFAFAIYDQVEKKLFLARDRSGKKPLYIYQDRQKILFASELNGLKSQLSLDINHAHLSHYLRLGTFYRSNTPYLQVTEFLPGHCAWIDCETLSIDMRRWWNIHDFYLKPNSASFDEALIKTEDLLRQGIRRRIESSDLEVACFLSGGIDSSLVVSMASEFKSNIKTLTVSFPGEYDESHLARKVAEKYATQHTEIQITYDNLRNDIERILYNYGEPFFDSSAVPSYYVSREAKKHVTVVLNGDGADELFGGYRRYVPFSKVDFLSNSNSLLSLLGLLRYVLPNPHNKKSKYNYLYRLASLARKKGLECYLSSTVDIMEDYDEWLIRHEDPALEQLSRDIDRIAQSDLTGLAKIMNLDFDTILCSDLLVKMDIATMANSLEGRSPFLCKELLEYAPTIPDRYKVRGGTTKHILRTMAQKYLPTELIHQPKRGFEVPLKDWVNHRLGAMIHEYLDPADSICKTILEPIFIQKLLQNKIRISEEKRAKILWMLFCMEVWYRKVYRSN